MGPSVSFPLPPRVAKELPIRNSQELRIGELPIPLPIFYYFEWIREVLANTLYMGVSQFVPKCPVLSPFVLFCPVWGPERGQIGTKEDKRGHFGTIWETPAFRMHPHLAFLNLGRTSRLSGIAMRCRFQTDKIDCHQNKHRAQK